MQRNMHERYLKDYISQARISILIFQNSGYKFPDGSLTMNLICNNREWVPERQGLMLIPDCERKSLKLSLQS